MSRGAGAAESLLELGERLLCALGLGEASAILALLRLRAEGGVYSDEVQASATGQWSASVRLCVGLMMLGVSKAGGEGLPPSDNVGEELMSD